MTKWCTALLWPDYLGWRIYTDATVYYLKKWQGFPPSIKWSRNICDANVWTSEVNLTEYILLFYTFYYLISKSLSNTTIHLLSNSKLYYMFLSNRLLLDYIYMEESTSTKTMYILLVRYHIFCNLQSAQLILDTWAFFLILYTQPDDGLSGPQYVYLAYCYIIIVGM
jgi:hypothetical protein